MRVVIVGSGPAGVSAALYSIRQGAEVKVISYGKSALQRAEKIENYYGLPSVSGQQLYQNGIDSAKALGVVFFEAQVLAVDYDGEFVVKSSLGDFHADSLILATGAPRKAPKIEGLARLEGRGVSYCAVCDGFFYRGKTVGVIGEGEFALHEALSLLPVAKNVIVFTNGKEPAAQFPAECEVMKEKILSVSGEERVEYISLEGGKTVAIDGIFVAEGVAGSLEFAKTLGIATQGGKIVVDKNMQTNIPRLYAVGDCTGGLMQVSAAVYEGALAGIAAAKK